MRYCWGYAFLLLSVLAGFPAFDASADKIISPAGGGEPRYWSGRIFKELRDEYGNLLTIQFAKDGRSYRVEWWRPGDVVLEGKGKCGGKVYADGQLEGSQDCMPQGIITMNRAQGLYVAGSVEKILLIKQESGTSDDIGTIGPWVTGMAQERQKRLKEELLAKKISDLITQNKQQIDKTSKLGPIASSTQTNQKPTNNIWAGKRFEKLTDKYGNVLRVVFSDDGKSYKVRWGFFGEEHNGLIECSGKIEKSGKLGSTGICTPTNNQRQQGWSDGEIQGSVEQIEYTGSFPNAGPWNTGLRELKRQIAEEAQLLAKLRTQLGINRTSSQRDGDAKAAPKGQGLGAETNKILSQKPTEKEKKLSAKSKRLAAYTNIYDGTYKGEVNAKSDGCGFRNNFVSANVRAGTVKIKTINYRKREVLLEGPLSKDGKFNFRAPDDTWETPDNLIHTFASIDHRQVRVSGVISRRGILSGSVQIDAHTSGSRAISVDEGSSCSAQFKLQSVETLKVADTNGYQITEKQPKTYSVEPKRKHLSKDVKKTDNISSERAFEQRKLAADRKREVEAAEQARLATERRKLAAQRQKTEINKLIAERERLVSEQRKLAADRKRALEEAEQARLTAESEKIAAEARRIALERQLITEAAERKKLAEEQKRLSMALQELSARKDTLNTSTPQASLRKGKRVALLIGNNNYETLPSLRNAVYDAESMAKKLNGLGWVTILETNAGRRKISRAMDRFRNQAMFAEASLVFYAGHGIESQGVNYLVPSDSEVQEEADLRYEAIKTGDFLDLMASSRSATNILILDSCRNNPLEQGTRGRKRGLGMQQLPNSLGGTVIIYAAAPGSAAEDGPGGGNGIFTGALLNSLSRKDTSLSAVFSNTFSLVAQKTQNRQRPWKSSSLDERRFRF